MKNTGILKSFKNAVCGIFEALKSERNLRFHFMIANLIIIFAYFYKITALEWAVLFLTIGLVFCAELINTAVENAVDTATREISKTAKLAKDASAGAVLVCAVISVVIGFMLFFDIQKITDTLTYIFSTPHILTVCLIIGVLDVIFVCFDKKKE